MRPNDPLKAILCTADPLERFRLAVASSGLPKGELSGVVADALAQLRPGAKDAAIVYLFDTGAAGRLNAAIAEQAAEIYRNIASFRFLGDAPRGRYAVSDVEPDQGPTIAPRSAESQSNLKANALAASYARRELATPGDAEAAYRAFDATQARLRGAESA